MVLGGFWFGSQSLEGARRLKEGGANAGFLWAQGRTGGPRAIRSGPRREVTVNYWWLGGLWWPGRSPGQAPELLGTCEGFQLGEHHDQTPVSESSPCKLVGGRDGGGVA